MAEEEATNASAIRLVNFISEEQLDLAKKSRGERVEDGTAQRDKPLYEILKENRDKKDAEFNERFKHRPPKALDEDETEFLDKLEEEALVAQASYVCEIEEAVPPKDDRPATVKRPPPSCPLNVLISIKPQAKKTKTTAEETKKCSTGNPPVKYDSSNEKDNIPSIKTTNTSGMLGALVSYSDESDDDA